MLHTPYGPGASWTIWSIWSRSILPVGALVKSMISGLYLVARISRLQTSSIKLMVIKQVILFTFCSFDPKIIFAVK